MPGEIPEEQRPKRCKLVSDGSFEGTSITVDGVDLGAFCTKMRIDIEAGEPVVVTLTLVDPIVELSTDECTFYKVCANCARELAAPPPSAASSPPLLG